MFIFYTKFFLGYIKAQKSFINYIKILKKYDVNLTKVLYIFVILPVQYRWNGKEFN